MSRELFTITASDIHPSPVPTVRINRRTKTVDVFGGGSPYSRSEPYSIRFEQVRTPADLVDWMAHVGAKRWARSSAFLWSFGQAMVSALESRG